ncbi:MAG: metallophosphoesterase family protein, partial [Clostridia bacterium]|nr:metallophosphoesterase family protein [Clostridia bacterium]
MKLLIASDIHGSAYYAEKLTERIAEEKADRVILLGDLLYHGPRNDLPKEYAPKKVIALLSALTPAPLCVRGN